MIDWLIDWRLRPFFAQYTSVQENETLVHNYTWTYIAFIVSIKKRYFISNWTKLYHWIRISLCDTIVYAVIWIQNRNQSGSCNSHNSITHHCAKRRNKGHNGQISIHVENAKLQSGIYDFGRNHQCAVIRGMGETLCGFSVIVWIEGCNGSRIYVPFHLKCTSSLQSEFWHLTLFR
jgi:hypothetical protein